MKKYKIMYYSGAEISLLVAEIALAVFFVGRSHRKK